MDMNETFKNLVFAEEISKDRGFDEGYKVGKNQFLKGYHLGYHQASDLAAQLGYYNGVIEYCLATPSCHQLKVEELKKLQDDINKFPKSNDQTSNILRTAEDIKYKFTKLCSLAKLNSTNPELKTLDF